jgi:hypothetical protein
MDKTISSLRLARVLGQDEQGQPCWAGGDTVVVQLGDVLDRGNTEIGAPGGARPGAGAGPRAGREGAAAPRRRGQREGREGLVWLVWAEAAQPACSSLHGGRRRLASLRGGRPPARLPTRPSHVPAPSQPQAS